MLDILAAIAGGRKFKPATPTARFTKRFKRLVNLLKLRKKLKWSTALRRIPGGAEAQC
jgi:hypothetical protein